MMAVMIRLLLVSPRRGAQAAAAEYNDVLRATGMPAMCVEQRVLDSPTATAGSTAGFDGLIIGGSPLNLTDDIEAAWRAQAIREILRLLDDSLSTYAICFGATVLASSLGSGIGTDRPEGAGATTVRLTDNAAGDPIFGRLPSTFRALTGHNEHITLAPAAARLLATGPTCPVQAFKVGTQTWASQFHPEMDAKGMANRMGFYQTNGYFDPSNWQGIVSEISRENLSASTSLLRSFAEHCAGERIETPALARAHAA